MIEFNKSKFTLTKRFKILTAKHTGKQYFPLPWRPHQTEKLPLIRKEYNENFAQTGEKTAWWHMVI